MSENTENFKLKKITLYFKGKANLKYNAEKDFNSDETSLEEKFKINKFYGIHIKNTTQINEVDFLKEFTKNKFLIKNIKNDILCEYNEINYTISPTDLFIIEEDLNPTHEQKDGDEIHGYFEDVVVYFKIFKYVKEEITELIVIKSEVEEIKIPYFIFSNNNPCYIKNNELDIDAILFNTTEKIDVEITLNDKKINYFSYDDSKKIVKLKLNNLQHELNFLKIKIENEFGSFIDTLEIIKEKAKDHPIIEFAKPLYDYTQYNLNENVLIEILAFNIKPEHLKIYINQNELTNFDLRNNKISFWLKIDELSKKIELNYTNNDGSISSLKRSIILKEKTPFINLISLFILFFCFVIFIYLITTLKFNIYLFVLVLTFGLIIFTFGTIISIFSKLPQISTFSKSKKVIHFFFKPILLFALIVIFLTSLNSYVKSYSHVKNNYPKTETIEKDKIYYEDEISDVDSVIIPVKWKSINKLYSDEYKLSKRDIKESYTFLNHISGSKYQTYGEIYNQIFLEDKNKLASLYKMLENIRLNEKLNELEFANLVVNLIQEQEYTIILEENCNDKSILNIVEIRNMIEEGIKCEGNYKFGIKSPTNFLHDLTGDCDTRTLTIYTILKHFDYDVVIINSNYYKHSMIGLSLKDQNIIGSFKFKNGIKYYFWETTAKDFEIGYLPKKMNNTNFWNVELN